MTTKSGSVFLSSFIVSSGAVLFDPTVSGGSGTVIGTVQSGGVVSGGTFLSSTIEELLGGTDSGSMIAHGAEQIVFSGGHAVGDDIAGSSEVLSGGTAASATIESGGILLAGDGAKVTNLTVDSGGSATVEAGAVVSDVVISGGGFLQVSAANAAAGAGSVRGGSVLSGGLLLDGGTDRGTTISAGGLLIVSGGTATDDTVASGGIVAVYAGGSVNSAMVDPGGLVVSTGEIVFASGGGAFYSAAPVFGMSAGFSDVVVLDGGRFDSGQVDNGAVIDVTSGGRADADFFFGGGTVSISAGGLGSGLTIGVGGLETVLSGGVDSGAILQAGGAQFVTSGGLAVSAFLQVDGEQFVSGGTTSATQLQYGSLQVVEDGGIAAATVVGSGGVEEVALGGLTTDTELSGLLYVLSGGLDSGSVVELGGLMTVSAGGNAEGELVASAGLVLVESGGILSGATLAEDGYVIALSGGVVDGTVSGGNQVVSTGVLVDAPSGITYDPTVMDGAFLSGGNAYVMAGGTLSSATGGGTVHVYASGLVSNTVVGGDNGVSSLLVSAGGAASDIEVSGLFTTAIDDAGTLTAATVSDHGLIEVTDGGTGIDDFVMSGGTFAVFDGGLTSGDVVGSAGLEEAVSGGTILDATVSGAWSDLDAIGGGIIVGATIEHGGVSFLATGGFASGSFVGIGGMERVFDGGTSTDETVSGGSVFVRGGGAVSDSVVEDGGLFFVDSGAAAASITVSSGGILAVAGGASVGDVTVDGGTVVSTGVIQMTADNIGSYDGASVSGVVFSAGEMVALSGGVISNVHLIGTREFFVLGQGTPGQGGYIAVEDGGSALGDVIGANAAQYGSEQDIFSGGIASGTLVDRSGTEAVLVGGRSLDVTVAGGHEVVSGIVSGLSIEQGDATVEVGGVASAVSIGSAGTIELTGGAAVEAETAGLTLAVGATVSLAGFNAVAGDTAVLDQTTDVLDVSIGGTAIDLQLVGDYSGDYFVVSGGLSGDPTIEVEEGTPCYCPGTLILTDRGEVPVEELAIGDRLVTAGGAARPLRWIGRRGYDGRFVSGRSDILPVTFAAGSLGVDGSGIPVPQRALVVSPLHAMFLDGMLVPAAALVDGHTITQAVAVERVDYIHLELDSHDVLLAEGAPSESFVDDGSRGMFSNAADYERLYPGQRRRAATLCAPRVEAGEQLEAIRYRLRLRITRAA